MVDSRAVTSCLSSSQPAMVINMNQSAAHEVIIGLGANLGDPVGQIDEAARRMQALATGEVRLSSFGVPRRWE